MGTFTISADHSRAFFTALLDVYLRAILDWISTATSGQATYFEDGYVELVILYDR